MRYISAGAALAALALVGCSPSEPEASADPRFAGNKPAAAVRFANFSQRDAVLYVNGLEIEKTTRPGKVTHFLRVTPGPVTLRVVSGRRDETRKLNLQGDTARTWVLSDSGWKSTEGEVRYVADQAEVVLCVVNTTEQPIRGLALTPGDRAVPMVPKQGVVSITLRPGTYRLAGSGTDSDEMKLEGGNAYSVFVLSTKSGLQLQLKVNTPQAPKPAEMGRGNAQR